MTISLKIETNRQSIFNSKEVIGKNQNFEVESNF